MLTLFPNEMGNFFLKGIFKKAHLKSLFEIEFINLRDFALDKHKKVDDYPFGLRQGMLLKPEVIYRAVTSIAEFAKYRIIYPCPKGKVFCQEKAKKLSGEKGLIFLPGYYEGIDERIFEFFNIERISLGNFILSSSETPVLLMTEAIIRLLPGVLKKVSIEDDSLITSLLEYPQYTKPREFMGQEVPEILISGHHENQKLWRHKMALKNTLFNKPNLLKYYQPNKTDLNLLEEIIKEV